MLCMQSFIASETREVFLSVNGRYFCASFSTRPLTFYPGHIIAGGDLSRHRVPRIRHLEKKTIETSLMNIQI